MSASANPPNPDGIIVPRPNGRGALKQGGRRNGQGRLKKELVELLEAKQRKALGILTGVLDVLETIARDETKTPDERIKAIIELRENSEKRDNKASLELNDNRKYASIEHKIYLPQLGVEVHQIPESVNGNGQTE
jgi:hypothetical protein